MNLVKAIDTFRTLRLSNCSLSIRPFSPLVSSFPGTLPPPQSPILTRAVAVVAIMEWTVRLIIISIMDRNASTVRYIWNWSIFAWSGWETTESYSLHHYMFRSSNRSSRKKTMNWERERWKSSRWREQLIDFRYDFYTATQLKIMNKTEIREGTKMVLIDIIQKQILLLAQTCKQREMQALQQNHMVSYWS